MEAITNTTNEQKCNQNIVDAMPALYAFALQQQVPVSDAFCWHSQHCSPGAVCLHTCIKLYVRDSSKKHTGQRGCNSNPVATLAHATVVFRMQPFNLTVYL